ncbi:MULTISPECIES: 1-deoxy-D-xylulose-5-phosphate synthase N-terminal domain-containing protein [Streptomyces]|uniref:1-deoxy-D-xylulose-5-phosphate synthase n=2 Tax=Streptomyces TaxID=1883 RepID=A0A2U9P1J1_STRAS|nr:1-deoxy-D-xylulose-5-phosphate synthase N-terminal domain-containing protein [Streptomyces actuosus]AWT43353.1 1-deoxy-D-xylulose-5-phosphate synthase [Streptomyces actuosus]MBM4824474.1 1-deoxy-D-xylulose-5-phosphate synthase [Streptomyces actuosus]
MNERSRPSRRTSGTPGPGLPGSLPGPRDVRLLEPARMPALAAELRDALRASGPGADAGSGAVELTLALHRVFDPSSDALLWDSAGRAAAHRLLVGWGDSAREHGAYDAYGTYGGYDAYGTYGGYGGYTVSAALCHADGLARALRAAGRDDRHVVVVAGAEALAGGAAGEALDGIVAGGRTRLVVVVVDDRRVLAGPGGAPGAARGYARFLDAGGEILRRAPIVGGPLHGALHGVLHSASLGARKGLGGLITPQRALNGPGLTYAGPVDGHSVAELEEALRGAKAAGGPVVVHCLTRATGGRTRVAEGGLPSRARARLGSAGATGGTGAAGAVPPPPSWASVFAEEMVKVGADRPDVVAVAAGALAAVGLGPFAGTYPERVVDLGRAEQHAVPCAAGLAAGGLHPVVALPSGGLARILGQLPDLARHRRGVVLAVTESEEGSGPEGEGSGPGGADLALLESVPGLRLAAPRDAARLRALLRQALETQDAPAAVRVPAGVAGPDIEAVAYDGGVDVLYRGTGQDVLVVSVGTLAPLCLEAARLLEADGVGVTVADPRWVTPVDPALTRLAAAHRLVVTVEDAAPAGGIGAALVRELNDANVAVPVVRRPLGGCAGRTGPARLARVVLARLGEER